MNKTAIFPGTFDPITHGHIDLVNRATQLFDHVLLAVTAGAGKSPAFSLEERIRLAQEVFADNPHVSIEPLSGLLVDFMQQRNINIVVRGIRALADVQYEFQLATMNQLMKPNLETVFLKPDERFSHISSTIVREIAAKGGENTLGDLTLFVPPIVVAAFQDQKNK